MGEWWHVARFEFLRIIRQRSYLLFTIGMPLFIILISMIPVVIELLSDPPTIGYVDQSGLLDDPVMPESDIVMLPFEDEQAGRGALDNEEIESLWIIPSDYLQGGTVQEIAAGDPSGSQRRAISSLLRENLLEGVDAQVATRLQNPAEWTYTLLDSGRELRQGVELIVALGVPIALSFLFMLSILFSAGFLAQAIAEERENRLLEMLITSTTLRSLLAGKVLGLSGLALVQVSLWLVAIGIGAAVFLLNGQLPSGLPIPWDVLAISLPFYFLAYILFATLIIGVGALLGDARAAQQAAGFIGFLGIVPIYFVAPLLNAPSGLLARVLSLVPLTAPTVVPARLALGQIDPPELLLSLAVLFSSVLFVIWLVARILQAATLRYGTRLSINDIFATSTR